MFSPAIEECKCKSKGDDEKRVRTSGVLDVPFSGVDANSANSANHTDYLEPPVLVEYPAM